MITLTVGAGIPFALLFIVHRQYSMVTLTVGGGVPFTNVTSTLFIVHRHYDMITLTVGARKTFYKRNFYMVYCS